MAEFDGDILILFSGGDFDLLWEGGQPRMTAGFESSVLLAIFGNAETWQNAIAETDEERYASRFPAVIGRATVSRTVVNDGIEALRDALHYLIDIGAAESVQVIGTIVSAHAIEWDIRIESPEGTGSRFSVLWDRGGITVDHRGGM